MFIAQHHYAPSVVEQLDYSAKVQYIKDNLASPLSGQNPRQCEKREFVAREKQLKNKYSQKWP